MPSFQLPPLFLPNFLILLFFVMGDLVWRRLSPSWGLSNGSWVATYILFFMLRIGFFILWILMQFMLRQVPLYTHHISLWVFLVPNLLLLGFGIYGLCIEPFRLTESHLEIRVPGLSQHRRIVQLSDLHVEGTTKRELALPRYVNNLHPDMIVITGDLINKSISNDPQNQAALRELVANLNAPLGIYIVNGNNDKSPQSLQKILQGLDARVLQDDVLRIPELGSQFVLLGLNYLGWSHDNDELAILMSQTKPDDFSLLLYHNPDLIYAASDLNVDLYLTGHTHGGQVRLPWYGALITRSRYGRRFQMGQFQVGKTTLFVSRGLGLTGGLVPQVRFLCPPEVVTIDLLPEK
jgi:predicted MPP superfamily phosphohydrolase